MTRLGGATGRRPRSLLWIDEPEWLRLRLRQHMRVFHDEIGRLAHDALGYTAADGA